MGLVVGVTGGIGSGKSALTDLLEARGISVVDADKAARVIVERGRPALAKIAEHFGPAIIQADGTLDRASLRQKVFADEQERLWLESLTHPLIGEEIQSQLERSTSLYTVLSSPLLLETNQKQLVDLTIVVDVPEEIQVKRAAKRDANSVEQVKRIMAAQLPRDDRLSMADLVVDNSGSLHALKEKVDELHAHLLDKSQAG